MQGAMPDAAAFLALVVPWPADGGPDFYVNIHRKVPQLDEQGQPRVDKRGKVLTYVSGRACKTINQAIYWMQIGETEKTADTYVCMSGQQGGELRIGRNGREYHGAARSTDGAVLVKGLWLDVDVKPDDPAKGYASHAEALEEFGRIRQAVGLPVPSVCVSTGSGGFHAHWTFAEPVDITVWTPLAFALVAAFVEKGFKGDTGCTIDIARLLRVPGTWNHKQFEAGTGPRLPVGLMHFTGHAYPIADLTERLNPWLGAAPQVGIKKSFKLLEGSMPAVLKGLQLPELSAGYEPKPIPSIAELAHICPFIMRSLATGGAANNNALWQTTTNIALFTREGKDAMHWMAQGHATYTIAENEDLWRRQLATKSKKNMGWPKCDTIAAQGATECRACPHFGQHRSPFNFIETADAPEIEVTPLAAPSLIASASATPLPHSYSYGPHGIILHEVADEDGKLRKEVLTLFPMLNPWLQDHPASINFTTVVGGQLGAVNAYTRQVKVPLSHLHDVAGMARGLADQHMVVHPNALLDFRSFLVSWTETLRKQRENIVQSAPFGWFRQDGKTIGFIYSRQIWSDGAPRPAANPDPMLERQYAPTGELQPWSTAAKMITDQQRPEFDAILASAFGAPLVGVIGQTGLLMSTYSPESGIGKSTVLRVAQAVWGHPVRAVQSLSDTQNSVLKKIGDVRSLPMYWDELKTDTDHTKFVQLAFQLAQGKEKSRLQSDTSYREVGTWETMLVSASNDSLINHIVGSTKTTSAGLARIFEFRVNPGKQGQIDISLAQRIVAALSDNYGHAGLVYAKFLGAERAAVEAEVHKELLALEKQFVVVAEERFWLATICSIVMGARFANKLKLTAINEKALREFMFTQFDAMRKERKTAPVDVTNGTMLWDHLARYLNIKRLRNTLITNTLHASSGRPTGVVMKVDANSKLDEVQVQVGQDDGRLRLLKSPFVNWLRDNQLSDRLILQELTKQLGMAESRGRLGVGTQFATQVEPVLDFQFTVGAVT